MPRHPKPEQDPSQPASEAVDRLQGGRSESEVADIAAHFSSQSVSPELGAALALDVVLNRIAEQACLATGATGAAIVLLRDGGMVCRASSGSSAPEPGSQLDTTSGVSGECIRTLRTQRCDDTLADHRADAAASLRLGVRSVMAMPLLRGQELLGIFELFSSLPYAFGDRDEWTLEALASRTLASLEQAANLPLFRKPPASERVVVPIENAVEPIPTAVRMEAEKTEEEAEQAEESTRTGSDVLTLVLAVAVVACAVLLGLLIGRHLGVQTAKTKAHNTARLSASANVRSAEAPTSTTSGEANSGKSPLPETPAFKSSGTSAVPAGGLRVYENGKEIFRAPPTPEGARAAAAAADHEIGVERAASVEAAKHADREVIEIPSAEVDDSLVHRVEPDYPEEARQQRIQGTVALELHINADGTVAAAHLASGPPLLAQAAIDAVKQWRFKPRTEDGRPVRMHTVVTLNFQLSQ